MAIFKAIEENSLPTEPIPIVGDIILRGSGASQEQAIVEEALPCGPIAEYCGAELSRDC
jgi:hypothetical protein